MFDRYPICDARRDVAGVPMPLDATHKASGWDRSGKSNL